MLLKKLTDYLDKLKLSKYEIIEGKNIILLGIVTKVSIYRFALNLKEDINILICYYNRFFCN